MVASVEYNLKHMKRALALAGRARGKTSPNPMVGAVLVKSSKVIGCGYHKKAGDPHAEIEAIADAVKKGNKRLIKGADLFVTLEPCNHIGRTAPCTEAIIDAGIGRVIVGAKDPNPKVSGKGIRRLRRAGVKVTTGVLKEECTTLNEAYNKYIVSGRPFVTLKLAMSIDGKIALNSGGSNQPISSKESHAVVHKMRSLADCVMVGSGTAVADDPRLTVRCGINGGVNTKAPMRAVVDSRLRIKPTARIFKASNKGEVLVFTSPKAPKNRIKAIEATGAEVITLPALKKDGRVNLKRLMAELGRREVLSLMVEGGAEFSAGLLEEGLVDKVVFFIAPKIIGSGGLSAIGDRAVKTMSGMINIKNMRVEAIGCDIMVTGYICLQG